ncbi:MAG: glutamate 5-kinase [Fimbriimonadaceae bacterium]
MSSPNPLAKAKRVVLKLGSQILIDDDGQLSIDRLASFVRQCVDLRREGRQVMIVSSGAVALGRRALGEYGKLALPEKQACAAIGQSMLMNTYGHLFRHYETLTAQVLLTNGDFSDRHSYLNVRRTIERLLQLDVVPIINENDTVSSADFTKEFAEGGFSDNDTLSAHVAAECEADALLILSRVNGIYTDNPEQNPDAEIIRYAPDFAALSRVQARGGSAHGRGGMASKLKAIKIAHEAGVASAIGSGAEPDAIKRLVHFPGSVESFPGTLVPAAPNPKVAGRRRWIGQAGGVHGEVTINEGAKDALLKRNACLLAVGITKVKGVFSPGQVVSVRDESGAEFARGISYFSSDELKQIQGHASSRFPDLLGGEVEYDVVIRRENLALTEKSPSKS